MSATSCDTTPSRDGGFSLDEVLAVRVLVVVATKVDLNSPESPFSTCGSRCSSHAEAKGKVARIGPC